MPPIGPIVPSFSISPVTATSLPSVSDPGVSRSMMASVHARPAEGPVTSPESTETLTSLRIDGSTGSIAIPRMGRAGVVGALGQGDLAVRRRRVVTVSRGSPSP